MAKRTGKKSTRRKATAKKPIESYDHTDKKRANNPPVGLVTPDTDPDAGHKRTYQYDPHLGPQLAWARRAKNLKAEIDEELIEAYRGTVSMPLEPSDHKRVTVKIIDDRGIENMKIVEVGV